jgi:hypothetical protein
MNRPQSSNVCAAPKLAELIEPYCFDDIPRARRDAFEQHLIECDACWQEVRRLSNSVDLLRSDARLRQTVSAPELIGSLAMSAALDQPFGGHRSFATGMAFMVGGLWTAGIWSELGYSYDRFGRLAVLLSLPVWLVVTASVLLAFQIDVASTRSGRTDGLWRSTAVLLVGVLSLVAVLLLILPQEPTIAATFTTRSAAAGYLKDAVVIFVPLFVLVLPPFDTIVRLQHELARRREGIVLGVLQRRAESIAPRGMLYLPPGYLAIFLVAYSAAKLGGANYMLDALVAGPFAHAFAIASYASTGLCLAIGWWGLAWYVSGLNELKREASALRKMSEHQ